MQWTDRQIPLPDGRLVGCSEAGSARGLPAFYFHGFPGSRLDAKFGEEMARHLNVRLISLDRPGIGLSQDRPFRTLLDWPDDVAALADALGVDRFSVVGVSGGAPYALACAVKIPHRLRSTGIVCGLGPLDSPGATVGMERVNRLGISLAGGPPFLMNLVFRFAAFMLRNYPERVVAHLARKLREPDRAILEREDVKSLLARSFRESVRRGFRGPLQDLRLYAAPWGFRLQDIRTEVFLWHGRLDVVVPPAMGEKMAEAIHGCRSRICDDEGHFSILFNRMKEIFHTLIENSRD